MDERPLPVLQVRLFGNFDLKVNGHSIPDNAWPQRKTAQLLKIFLINEGNAVSVDQLIESLYPDLEPAKARRNIQRRLSELRGILEPSLGKASQSNIVLRRGNTFFLNEKIEIDIDTKRFKSFVADGHQAKARSDIHHALKQFDLASKMYKSSFLLEDLYEDWTSLEREKLNSLYLDAVEQAAICELSIANYSEAILLSSQYLEASPTTERVYRLKMMAHYFLRDDQQVVQAYETCRDALRSTLDVEVSEELTALYEQLKAHELPYQSNSEIAPQKGQDRNVQIADDGRTVKRQRASVRSIALLGLIVAIVSFGLWSMVPTLWRTPESEEISMAILPFEILSPAESLNSIAEGIRIQLIHEFSELSGFRIISRNSVDIALNKGSSLRETLKANVSLEGSLQISQQILQITVQLTNLQDGTTLWSQTYDRPYSLDHIFGIQSDISRQVTVALNVELTDQQIADSSVYPTESLEAYNHFWNARYLQQKSTPEAFLQAKESYESALEIDPSYAKAYTGLAELYTLLMHMGMVSPDEALYEASALLNKAEELGGFNAETKSRRGLVQWMSLAWEDAIISFENALDLNPNDANTYFLYGQLLLELGTFDKALEVMEKSLLLDPHNFWNRRNILALYVYSGQFAKAKTEFQKLINLEPTEPYINLFMSKAMFAEKDFESALHFARIESKLLNPLSVALAEFNMMRALIALGGREEALLIKQNMLARADSEYVPLAIQAMAHFLFDEDELGFERLGNAISNFEVLTHYLKVDDAYDPVRSHPSFEELLILTGLND
jgi:DNA-binding SARP family transcriptional activator/TolB-like protein/Tfp pilus assembly protein PilF